MNMWPYVNAWLWPSLPQEDKIKFRSLNQIQIRNFKWYFESLNLIKMNKKG